MDKYYVYKHLKKGTEEVFYIGRGCGRRAYWKYDRNDFWKKIESKYGRDVVLVKENLSNDEANELEIELIKKYGRMNKGLGTLVNTDGGESTVGYIPTDETRMKISKAHKGRKHSDEWRENQRISLQGVNKGMKHTEETKEKMSKANKKCIEVINIKTGEIYYSISIAAKKNDINQKTLHNQLTGVSPNKTNLKIKNN